MRVWCQSVSVSGARCEELSIETVNERGVPSTTSLMGQSQVFGQNCGLNF